MAVSTLGRPTLQVVVEACRATGVHREEGEVAASTTATAVAPLQAEAHQEDAPTTVGRAEGAAAPTTAIAMDPPTTSRYARCASKRITPLRSAGIDSMRTMFQIRDLLLLLLAPVGGHQLVH